MELFTAEQALEMAMDIEKNGEVFYTEIATKQADPEIKAFFEDLAVQERGHHRVFQNMLEEMHPTSEPPGATPSAYYDEYQAYMQVALDNALFAGPDKALALARQAEDLDTALRAALGFEKDTLLFYYDLSDMMGKADQETIAKIILEEKKHLRRLARMIRG
jgi:rubrerythrin